jgi:RNA polymerase sigma-70 factor (ECF subfamily)
VGAGEDKLGIELNDAMDRYATGDDAAFVILYDALSPRLLAFLRRGLSDDAMAQDLLQQTFLQIHAARERYNTGLDVVPWAFAIARRLRIDAFRKSGRESFGDDTEGVPSQRSSPLEDLEHMRAATALQAALESLPEPQREIYELVEGEGLTMAQAADVLGTTVMAVKLRLHRARQALQSAARQLAD